MLDLLGRCLKLSVSAESISCHEFAFEFGLAIFVYAKNIKNLGEVGWVARVFISMTLLPAMNASVAVCHGWSQMNSANLYGGGDGGVCVCSRMRVRACVGMRACLMGLQCTILIVDVG